MPTVKEILADLPRRFDPETARGVKAVIQYRISGPRGGSFHALVSDGRIEVHEGAHPSPDLTLTMSDEDCVEIATGKLSDQMAFMSGRLRIAGDMGLAVRMPSLLRMS